MNLIRNLKNLFILPIPKLNDFKKYQQKKCITLTLHFFYILLNNVVKLSLTLILD